MNLIVAGGRDFTDIDRMDLELKTLTKSGFIHPDAKLICGMARGTDLTAHFLWKNVYQNPIEEMPADWDTHGKSAGYIRNYDMGKIADKAVCFWDGKSKGTANMISVMEKLKKPVMVIKY